jgi:hypothetical protein
MNSTKVFGENRPLLQEAYLRWRGTEEDAR